MSNAGNEILKRCIDKYINYYMEKKEYSYWPWSICTIMDIDNIEHHQSHVHYDNTNGKKYQFLNEHKFESCEYNNIVVLNNRYKNYSNHHFVH